MSRPGVRLAFSSLLWRTTVLFFFLLQLARWVWIRRVVRRNQAIAAMVIWTPRVLFYAFLLGAIVTVLADLLVRFVIRPLVRRWLSPPNEELVGSFHLDARERILRSTPARRSAGMLWPPGQLVLTDRKVWFFPSAWDAEPWSMPLDRCQDARTVEAPRFLLGFVTDLPERLQIPTGPGQHETFVLLDPDLVLSHVRESSAARSPA